VQQDWSSSLAEKVFRVLEAAIRRGDMKPGNRVYDYNLAKEFGVSRSPVREALKRLEYCGLIQVLPRRGTYVSQLLSAQEVAELLEVREVLEGLAARRAALHASHEQVEAIGNELRTTAQRLHATGELGYGLDFHAWLLDASGNAKLKSTLTAIQGQVRLVRFRVGASRERAEQALHEHAEVREAIRNREADLAEARMRAHIRAGRENVLRSWPSPPHQAGEAKVTPVTAAAAESRRSA